MKFWKEENQKLKEQLNKEKEDNEYYKELLKVSVKGGKGNNIIIMVNNHFGDAKNLLAPKKASYSFRNDLIEQGKNLLLDSNEEGEDKFYYDNLTEMYGRGRDKRNDEINREKCKNSLANYIATGIRVLLNKSALSSQIELEKGSPTSRCNQITIQSPCALSAGCWKLS
mgnify:CR=1 FL=1